MIWPWFAPNRVYVSMKFTSNFEVKIVLPVSRRISAWDDGYRCPGSCCANPRKGVAGRRRDQEQPEHFGWALTRWYSCYQ